MADPTQLNPSFNAGSRSEAFQNQIRKLEAMTQGQPKATALGDFDDETEQMILNMYGNSHPHLEAYKYAVLGEAETMINLPEQAQEDAAVDTPRKAVQQRRQVLEGILSDLQTAEAEEAVALTGEDHEDPPGHS